MCHNHAIAFIKKVDGSKVGTVVSEMCLRGEDSFYLNQIPNNFGGKVEDYVMHRTQNSDIIAHFVADDDFTCDLDGQGNVNKYNWL